MHFSFKLLRIKGLYMFRTLLVHPQEAIHKRHLVYCVRIMSVGCATIAVSLQTWHSQFTLYSRNIQNAVCVSPPEDEQVMLETRTGSWFSINWMKSASRWFHYTDIQFLLSARRHTKQQHVRSSKWVSNWKWRPGDDALKLSVLLRRTLVCYQRHMKCYFT
jgi:hypothetical protein